MMPLCAQNVESLRIVWEYQFRNASASCCAGFTCAVRRANGLASRRIYRRHFAGTYRGCRCAQLRYLATVGAATYCIANTGR